MGSSVSSDILEKWLNAWSLSRELPLATKFKSGYKVDVGYQKQKARYVFAELNDDFIQLSETINENCIFLKVCASPEEIKNKISERWVIQPQGYMMSCVSPMNISDRSLPDGYEIQFDRYNSTTVVKIVAKDGQLASTGHIVIVDDLAVYDRISTEENHKRKGLATFLIKELERIAMSKNVYKNFLVATEQGKLLYQSLGSMSAVVPRTRAAFSKADKTWFMINLTPPGEFRATDHRNSEIKDMSFRFKLSTLNN